MLLANIDYWIEYTEKEIEKYPKNRFKNIFATAILIKKGGESERDLKEGVT